MMYRNRKTGKEVPGELALEYALDACGIALVDPSKVDGESFAEWFEDWFYNLEDWEEIEDEEEDEDEFIDLEECNRKEWADLMRERLFV